MPRALAESSLPRYPGDYPAFFEAYGDALARAVTRQFPPRYTLDVRAAWRERAGRLARCPFPAQLHAAAAVAIRLERHPAAFLVGEPSTGKTQIALTAAALLDARRILVLGPSYLLPQWADEIRAVLPEARVYTDMTTVRRVREITDDIAARDGVSIVLLSRDQAKLGYPWRASAIERTVTRDAAPPPRHPAPHRPAARPPDQRRAEDRSAGRRRSSRGDVFLPRLRAAAVRRVVEEGAGPRRPLREARGRRTPFGVDGRAPRGRPPALPALRRGVLAGRPHDLRTRGLRRGEYLARQYPRFFDLLVVDELQSDKDRDSAQGQMLTRLVQASRKTLAQTGTLMDGKPSTVFYLLHRLLPAGGEIFYELAKAILGHARVADVHDTLRALSASARAQAELCDPALATRAAALVGAAAAAAPAVAAAAPRRRRIAVTRHIATQQTSLFEFESGA
jgi:hypothetical protein